MNMPQVQNQKRREDRRFITGAGRYTADVLPEGTLHVAFTRAPYAHARIVSIDTATASAAEGVVAVITAADLEAAGLKPIPGGFRFARPDGTPAPKTNRPALAADRVRYIGQTVAAVVATTEAQAIAAAEQVEVEYESAPNVLAADARSEGAAAVWEEAPDNIAFCWKGGDAEAVDAALKTAAHVTRLTMHVTRVCAHPMETRNILARRATTGGL